MYKPVIGSLPGLTIGVIDIRDKKFNNVKYIEKFLTKEKVYCCTIIQLKFILCLKNITYCT